MAQAPMNELIAVVDDEHDIVELVKIHLQRAGFRVAGFLDAKSFWRSLDRELPRLLILDLMLPDADGFEVCRLLRKNEKFSAIPVIMLTARSEETDKLLGLEIGADDYVTKPFSAKELIARVRAVLRRGQPSAETSTMEVGGLLSVDPATFEARVEGQAVDLTSTEFRILKLLVSKPGRVFSRQQILDYLWGHEKIVLDRTIDVHIRNLRDKLGPAARLVKNIRGVGYKVEP
jgi:two-component system phosphate regulon response regulator PhoB/two-component system alkaline phosphatase synthesis response regulator PhoP